MGHPAMMKAIGASKKKNDQLDARKIADLVRCHLLPVCYVAPAELRELRRLLRYRNLVLAQAVRMKNKMSGLLMEVGAEYNKQQLHGAKYFTELLDRLEEVPESVKDLLRPSRGAFARLPRQSVIAGLLRHWTVRRAKSTAGRFPNRATRTCRRRWWKRPSWRRGGTRNWRRSTSGKCRERGALGLLLHPERSCRVTICQRSTGRSSLFRRLYQGGDSPPYVPNRLFRGRPVHSNSIFVDGFMLFPQMDVWSRWLRLGPGRSVFSLDKSLSWMSPGFRPFTENLALGGVKNAG